MLGDSVYIVNNKLFGLGDDCVIHIDYAYITNTQTNELQSLVLERTGCCLNGSFRAFSDYVFFIQNNLIQHSGHCVTMDNLQINSEHVRIQRGEECKRAVIINNVLTETDETTGLNSLTRNIYINENNNNINRARVFNPIVDTRLLTPTTSLSKIARDSQGVHDSNVVNKFKFSYAKMIELIKRNCSQSYYNNFSLDLVYSTIKDAYRNKSNESKEKLEKVLVYSKNQNGFVYNLQSTEVEVLKNVVVYILNCVNQQYQSDTFILLCDNMLDCIEHEMIVCLTGRVTRMLNSVYHFIDIHLSMKDKYSTVADARKEMLRIVMEMFNANKSADEIRKHIYKEFDWLSIEELETEVNSWKLEDMY